MEPENIRACRRLVAKLERRTYFSLAASVYQEAVIRLAAEAHESEQKAHIRALTRLHDLMRACEARVEAVIQRRIADDIINDADQTRKSVAGNLFQQLVAYALAQNILCGNITAEVTVALTGKKNPLLAQYAAIQVGDDVQKPDSDVLVYAAGREDTPILNFSCKTSCRERAGQTYKWKLLSDLATCRCTHKEDNPLCPITQYELRYEQTRPVRMCFVTADFYQELANPQIAAMFHFFDHAYIAKPQSPVATVQTFDQVVEDINRCYAE